MSQDQVMKAPSTHGMSGPVDVDAALALRNGATLSHSTFSLFASAETVGRLAFSPAEVAKLLGLPGPWTVRRLIQTGKLRARQTGARYIIPGWAVVEFLQGADAPMRAGGDAA